MRTVFVSLVVLLGLPLTAASSLAKPAPPGDLETAYTVFTELGARLDESKWDEAETLSFKAYNIFRGVVPELSKTVNTKTIMEYRALLEKLRSSLNERNEARCRRLCATLEMLFLDTLEQYDFATHPALKVIHQRIISAEEALAQGGVSDLSDDLRRIGSLFEEVQKVLEERGVAYEKLFGFRKDLIAAEESVVTRDVAAAAQAVQKLRKTTEVFLKER